MSEQASCSFTTSLLLALLLASAYDKRAVKHACTNMYLCRGCPRPLMFVSGGPQEPCPRGIGWEVGPLPLRNARIFATHRSLQIASHEKSVAFLTERVIPLRLLLLKTKAQLISCADRVQSCNSRRKNGTYTVPTLHCNSLTATKVQHATKWLFSQNRGCAQHNTKNKTLEHGGIDKKQQEHNSGAI